MDCVRARARARACLPLATPFLFTETSARWLGVPGGLVGASWGPLGASWSVLGASRSPWEASWGALGLGFLGPAWEALGEFPRIIHTP